MDIVAISSLTFIKKFTILETGGKCSTGWLFGDELIKFLKRRNHNMDGIFSPTKVDKTFLLTGSLPSCLSVAHWNAPFTSVIHLGFFFFLSCHLHLKCLHFFSQLLLKEAFEGETGNRSLHRFMEYPGKRRLSELVINRFKNRCVRNTENCLFSFLKPILMKMHDCLSCKADS